MGHPGPGEGSSEAIALAMEQQTKKERPSAEQIKLKAKDLFLRGENERLTSLCQIQEVVNGTSKEDDIVEIYQGWTEEDFREVVGQIFEMERFGAEERIESIKKYLRL